MPHLIIEHNFREEEVICKLCKELHALVANFDTIDIKALKTRSTYSNNLIIGSDSKTDGTFLHARLFLLKGRAEALKEKMAEDLLTFIKKTIRAKSISVEVLDLQVYVK